MYTLGIDIGSTTSKCAVLKDGTELVGKSLQRGGLGTDACDGNGGRCICEFYGFGQRMSLG